MTNALAKKHGGFGGLSPQVASFWEKSFSGSGVNCLELGRNWGVSPQTPRVLMANPRVLVAYPLVFREHVQREEVKSLRPSSLFPNPQGSDV